MNKRVLALCILPFLANLARADSIDDAEAKRRGIPVSQVQAENALAAEKMKTADLEKQIADLQRKIAEAKAGAPGSPADPSQTSPKSAGTPTAAANGTAGAAPPLGAPPGSTLNFDGPREASTLYDDLVQRYLDGDWATLAADLKAKQKDMKALPAGNVADLTYIQQVLAESRPAWWDKIEAGKITQFKQYVWKQEITVTFASSPRSGIVKTTISNGATLPTLTWPAEKMDAADPLNSMEGFYLNMPGGNGFLARDQTNFSIWSIMGSAGLLAEVGADKRKALPPDKADQYTMYQEFRQDITAAYYGTPPTRRAVCLRGIASLGPFMNGNISWAGVRPVGAAVLLELAGHADRYQSIALDPKTFIPNIAPGGPTTEAIFSTTMVPMMLDHRLTLAEDRHIRDLFRALADANPTWNGEAIALPDNLHWHLDLAQDATYAAERKAFFAAHLSH